MQLGVGLSRSRSRGHEYSDQVEQTHISAAATAAKLLQSCPTLCNPIDSSPGSSLHRIL